MKLIFLKYLFFKKIILIFTIELNFMKIIK